jgi:hypothetical protein
MKSITRNFLPEIFTNSISRNLIIIILAALFAAIFIVTATIVLFGQW